MLGLILAPGLDDFISEASIEQIKPDCVAFLVTEATINRVNCILNKCDHKIKEYRIYFLKDIFSTSDTVQEFFNAFYWLSKTCNARKIVVDGTNCITVIEMATYIAASVMEVFRDFIEEKTEISLIYVHSDFSYTEKGVGVEIPGTQKIVELEHPYDSIGFIPAMTGIKQFNNHFYKQAHDVFNSLAEHTTGEHHMLYTGLSELADAFNYWDKFQLEKASNKMSSVMSKLGKVKKHRFVFDVLKVIDNNINTLNKTKSEKISVHKMVDLFENAERRISLRRFDDALARYYSCLEMISRFCLKEYEIEAKKPDYEKLPKEAVQAFKESIGSLPPELGLKMSFILLSYLGHPIGEVVKDIGQRKFLGLIGYRNESILAHGSNPISEDNCKKFRDELTFKFLKVLCQLEKLDFESMRKEHQHIKLPQDIKEIMTEFYESAVGN